MDTVTLSLEELKVHEKKHESDIVEYEFTLETHKKCTEEDAIETLKTNFHCPLDDRKVDKYDQIRHFKVEKVNQQIKEENENILCFKVKARNDEEVIRMIENWRNSGQFDDRAFRNSTHYEITIRIKELRRTI